MELLDTLQMNLPSGILFWLVFLISIIASNFYQKIRLEKNEDGSIKIRKINKLAKFIMITIIVIFPALLIGLRAHDLGYDTTNYVTSFLNIQYNFSLYNVFYEIFGGEPLYHLFRYLTFIIFNGNPTVFLFLMAFLTLYIFILGLDKWIDKISISLALFTYYALFGLQLLNQSRQLFALSILFYGFYYLANKKYWKYFLIVIIATSIHFSAIIGIFFPLLNFKENNFYSLKKRMFLLSLFILPVLMYPIFTIIKYIIPESYSSYLINISYDGIGLGLILTLIPVFLPIIIYYPFLKKKEVSLFVRIASLTFPFRLAGYYSYYIMRMHYYGAIAMVFINRVCQ